MELCFQLLQPHTTHTAAYTHRSRSRAQWFKRAVQRQRQLMTLNIQPNERSLDRASEHTHTPTNTRVQAHTDTRERHNQTGKAYGRPCYTFRQYHILIHIVCG